jgi:hypothetical protein
LTVNYLDKNNGQIRASGCDAQGVDTKFYGADTSAFFQNTVPQKLGDWNVCTNSNQCINQCCSGKYSQGVIKCTPVGGFKPWEGCTGSATRYLRHGGDDADSGLRPAAKDEKVEELVWDSLEYEAAAEDMYGAVLN